MRLIGRHDAYLLAALVLAAVVIFARPFDPLLEYAREVERSSGHALAPALVLLTVAFLLHQLRKRHEMQAEAAAAAAEAHAATTRAEELEQLVVFGDALARSLDLDSIREAVSEHLPHVTGVRPVWMVVRRGRNWERLVGGGDDEEWHERECAAAAALASERIETEPDEAGDACFALIAGGTAVGVLGVSVAEQPLSVAERRTLGAAAALLAVSLRNAQLFAEMRETSVRDALTGCFNRAHALEVIEAELKRARRSRLPLSLVMFDLDHFKQINDRYGHLCGDAVLAALGARMNQVLRGSDLKCRYGGEEFLLLLPDTPLNGANHVADTLRRELAEHPVTWNGEQVSVTASFGITAAATGEIDVNALIARADAALYRAKHDGRNCIRVAAEPLST